MLVCVELMWGFIKYVGLFTDFPKEEEKERYTLKDSPRAGTVSYLSLNTYNTATITRNTYAISNNSKLTIMVSVV